MGQAVQHRSGQPFTAHHFGPLFKGQIGRDDQAGAFIRPADYVEQQFRPGLGERDVTEFVQQQDIQPFQVFVQPLQGPRFPLFEQLGHEARGGHEPHALTLSAGGKTQCARQMRLARTRIADQ